MAENGDRLFPVERVKRTRRQLRLRRSTDATIELREFGEWTLEKLKVLELYLKQYRRVAGNGTYIDGFAGQGSVAVAGQITMRRAPCGSLSRPAPSKSYGCSRSNRI